MQNLINAAQQNPAAAAELQHLAGELEKLIAWKDDLQSKQHLNCVFCGHRFGPSKQNHPRDLLQKHMCQCPAHPLSKLLGVARKMHQALDGVSEPNLAILREEIRFAIEAAEPPA